MGFFSADEHRCFATIASEQGPLEGVVIDNDESSVLIEFPFARSPRLPIAEMVELRLTANDPSVTSQVRARVVHYGRRAGSVRYRFRLPAQEAPDLVRLFRRRNAYRAQPDPRHPVAVLVQTPDGLRSNAEIFDISVTGLSLVVDPDDESALFHQEPLKLSFHLPGQSALLELHAHIRTRALHGSAIRYGLEYDAEATARPALQSERIMEYVVQRQLESIHSRKAG